MDMGQGEEAEQSLFSNLLCNSGPKQAIIANVEFPLVLRDQTFKPHLQS